MTGDDLKRLMITAVTQPRRAYQYAYGLELPRLTLWQLLLVLSIARVLALSVMPGNGLAMPVSEETVLVLSPLSYTFVLVTSAVVMVFLIYYVGRALEGTGTFDGALTAVVLIETLSVILVAVQLVLSVISLELAALVALSGAIAIVMCIIVYVDEVHGFDSLWKAMGCLLLGIVGLTIGLSVLLVLIGVGGQF